MKKLLAIGGALAVAVLAAPAFMAFEAHVINVTATIENALGVSTNAIDFGTVFPQEHLDQPLEVRLSGSFLAEDRVDDVEYFIRQKPKCGVTTLDGQTLVPDSTATGHIVLGNNPATVDVTETYWIDCGVAPVPVDSQHQYGVLPSLCEYISKESADENDGNTASFHKPWEIMQGDNPATPAIETSWIKWTDTNGRLAKSEQDTVDNWTIDLAVPCFGGFCAQDWADFVHLVSEDESIDPNLYTQPIENEHKVFGCDLWVEVDGVTDDNVI